MFGTEILDTHKSLVVPLYFSLLRVFWVGDDEFDVKQVRGPTGWSELGPIRIYDPFLSNISAVDQNNFLG